MIPRYTRSMMSQIWEPENRFTIWLEIEILALEALVNKGEMSRDVVRSIRTKAKFNIERIETLEKELKHDVIAFLTCVAEFVGPDSRFIHKGLTSSDILDTAFAVQLKQAGDLLIQDIDSLMSILKLRAYEFKDTVMVGRSHGIHGEPVTFGLKLALWYEEMKRNRERLLAASTDVAVGKLSGAMGTFAHNDPFIEKYVCEKLGLKPDPISTQVVQRDRHAHFFQTLSLVGASLDKIATEIRHLQRTEVYEVEEYFSPGQKGSSAMPHKRNPVLSENISGLSRLLRGYALSAIENVALWHERDISHSSVERVIGPDATIVLDFMLDRSCGIISKLLVYPENMKTNLGEMKGLIYSQRVLLALIDAGMSREDAYKVVQKSAMKVWEQDADFLSELKKDDKISRYLNAQDLNPLFDVKYYLRHVDSLFKRIFI